MGLVFQFRSVSRSNVPFIPVKKLTFHRKESRILPSPKCVWKEQVIEVHTVGGSHSLLEYGFLWINLAYVFGLWDEQTTCFGLTIWSLPWGECVPCPHIQPSLKLSKSVYYGAWWGHQAKALGHHEPNSLLTLCHCSDAGK